MCWNTTLSFLTLQEKKKAKNIQKKWMRDWNNQKTDVWFAPVGIKSHVSRDWAGDSAALIYSQQVGRGCERGHVKQHKERACERENDVTKPVYHKRHTELITKLHSSAHQKLSHLVDENNFFGSTGTPQSRINKNLLSSISFKFSVFEAPEAVFTRQ